jgi:hypothetical protein
MARFVEFIVEEAELDWLGKLEYAAKNGLESELCEIPHLSQSGTDKDPSIMIQRLGFSVDLPVDIWLT